MQKKVYINTFANLAGMIFQGIIILFMSPLYLKELGKEQWGLVAALMSLQGILLMIDLGLAQVMPRDFSRDISNRKKIYYNYLTIYMILGGVAAYIINVSADYFATQWFKLDAVLVKQFVYALHIFSIQFFFQFCNNVNLAYWNGCQHQIKTNVSQCSFLFFKHLLAFYSVKNCDAIAINYILSFMVISLIEFSVNFLIIYFKDKLIVKPQARVIKSMILDNYKLSFGIILGVFSSQLDRIFLSQELDIEVFGIYVMVVQLGLALLQLQYPIVKATLPFLAKNDADSNLGYFPLLSFIIVSIPSVIMFFFTKDILYLWSKNAEVVRYGEQIIKVLSIAVLVNFFYNFVHVKLVINNYGKILITLQLIVILANGLFLYIFTPKLHEVAGAYAWLINFSLILFMGKILILRKERERKRWM